MDRMQVSHIHIERTKFIVWKSQNNVFLISPYMHCFQMSEILNGNYLPIKRSTILILCEKLHCSHSCLFVVESV